MPETVTIQLSDGQPFTATPDSDRWIQLPRGAKPAEPWFSECEADCLGYENAPDGLRSGRGQSCSTWNWLDDGWYPIRPTEGRSWSDIAPKQPAEPSGEVARLTAERDALLAVLRMVNVAISTDANGKIGLVQHDEWPPLTKADAPALRLARAVMEREGGAA